MFEAIRVSGVPERATALPGGQAVYALTVRNASSIVDRYRLAVAGLPEGWARLDQEALSLFPGASGRAQLTVAPPPGTVAGEYPLTVTATSEDDPSIRAEATLALSVPASGGVSLDLLPASAEGRQAVFRLAVTNDMNKAARVRVEARDNEEGLEFRYEPGDELEVPAGAERALRVHVRPKKRETIGAPHPYEIEFRGVLLGADDASADPRLQRMAIYTYTPPITALFLPAWLRRLPGWALILGLLAIILLLLLAGQGASAALARIRGPNVGATQTAVAATVATAQAGVAARLTAQAGTAATAQAQAHAQATAVAAVQATMLAQAHAQQTAQAKALKRAQSNVPRVKRFGVQKGKTGPQLAWAVLNARQVFINGQKVGTQGLRSLHLTKETTITLSAAGQGGTVTQVLHAVPPKTTPVAAVAPTKHLSLPTIDRFKAAHDAATGALTLSWHVSGATAVTLNGATVSANGSTGITPASGATYVLQASNGLGTSRSTVRLSGGSSGSSGSTGSGGATSASTVNVNPPVIDVFTLAHGGAGQPYRLVWQTHGASRVTLDGQTEPASGSLRLPSPLRTAAHTLSANNDAGSAEAVVRVVVGGT